ncbi:MAG: hypothetical protein RL235_853 [Chlamydiota bacterium]
MTPLTVHRQADRAFQESWGRIYQITSMLPMQTAAWISFSESRTPGPIEASRIDLWLQFYHRALVARHKSAALFQQFQQAHAAPLIDADERRHHQTVLTKMHIVAREHDTLHGEAFMNMEAALTRLLRQYIPYRRQNPEGWGPWLVSLVESSASAQAAVASAAAAIADTTDDALVRQEYDRWTRANKVRRAPLPGEVPQAENSGESEEWVVVEGRKWSS